MFFNAPKNYIKNHKVSASHSKSFQSNGQKHPPCGICLTLLLMLFVALVVRTSFLISKFSFSIVELKYHLVQRIFKHDSKLMCNNPRLQGYYFESLVSKKWCHLVPFAEVYSPCINYMQYQ